MVKKALKQVWLEIVWSLEDKPLSIKAISEKAGTSWEATKNALEVLAFLCFIDISLKGKEPKFMRKQKYISALEIEVRKIVKDELLKMEDE